MTTPLLTIAEAVERTGRSPSTVRRLIRTITDARSHVDRAGIRPSPKEVEVLKKRGENFTWQIREEVLMKHCKEAPIEGKKSMQEPADSILQILQRELDLKNTQIEKQWEVIQSLNDRLREGNILMGALQKRLSLPPPETPLTSPLEATTVEGSTEAVQKAFKRASKGGVERVSKEASMAASTTIPKKGIFSWFRR